MCFLWLRVAGEGERQVGEEKGHLFSRDLTPFHHTLIPSLVSVGIILFSPGISEITVLFRFIYSSYFTSFTSLIFVDYSIHCSHSRRSPPWKADLHRWLCSHARPTVSITFADGVAASIVGQPTGRFPNLSSYPVLSCPCQPCDLNRRLHTTPGFSVPPINHENMTPQLKDSAIDA